jgi:hypothetical protein
VHIEFVHNSSFGVQIDLLASVIIGPVFQLHAASLNCSVESKEDQSCVSVLCRFCKGNSHGKAHGCCIANLDRFAVSHEG